MRSRQQSGKQNKSSKLADNGSSLHSKLYPSASSPKEKPVILSISSSNGKSIKSSKAHHYNKDHTANLVTKTSQIVVKQNQETIVADHSLIGVDQLIEDNNSSKKSNSSKKKIRNENPDPNQITTTAVLISDGRYRKLSSSDGEYVTLDSISEDIEQIPKNKQYKSEDTDSLSFNTNLNKKDHPSCYSEKSSNSKRKEMIIQTESDSNFDAPLSPYNPFGLRSVESQSTASRQMKRQQNPQSDPYSLTDESEYEYMYINEEEEEEDRNQEDQYEYQYEVESNQEIHTEEEQSESVIQIENDDQQEFKSLGDVPPLNVANANSNTQSEIENQESSAASINEEEINELMNEKEERNESINEEEERNESINEEEERNELMNEENIIESINEEEEINESINDSYPNSFSRSNHATEIRSNSDLKFSESSQNQNNLSIISDQEISIPPNNEPEIITKVEINDEEIEEEKEDQSDVVPIQASTEESSQAIKNKTETPISRKILMIAETEAMEYINPHPEESSTLINSQSEQIPQQGNQTNFQIGNLVNYQIAADNSIHKNEKRESIQIQTENNITHDQIHKDNKVIKPNISQESNDNDDVNEVFKSLSYSTIENEDNHSVEESTMSVFQEYVFADDKPQSNNKAQEKKVSIESSFEFHSEKPIKRTANQIAHSINKLTNKKNITQDSTTIIDDTVDTPSNEIEIKETKENKQHPTQIQKETKENQQHSSQIQKETKENQQHLTQIQKEPKENQQHSSHIQKETKENQQHSSQIQKETSSFHDNQNEVNPSKETEEEDNFEKELQQVQRSPLQEQKKAPTQLCLSPTNMIETCNNEPTTSYLSNQQEKKPSPKKGIKTNLPQKSKNDENIIKSPKYQLNEIDYSTKKTLNNQPSSDEITTATYETEINSNKKLSSTNHTEYYSDDYYSTTATVEERPQQTKKVNIRKQQTEQYTQDYSYSSDSYTYMTIETKSTPIKINKPTTDYDYYSDDMTDFTLDYIPTNYQAEKRKSKQISYHKQELPSDLQNAIQEQLQLQLRKSQARGTKPSLFKIRVKDEHLNFLNIDQNSQKQFVVNTIDRHGKMTPHKVRLLVDPNQLHKSQEKPLEIIKSGPHKGMIKRRIKKSEKLRREKEKLSKKEADKSKSPEKQPSKFVDAGIDMSPSFINRNEVPTTKTRNATPAAPSVSSSTSSARKRFYDENGNPALVEMSDTNGRPVFRRILPNSAKQTPQRIPIPKTPPRTQQVVHHIQNDRVFTPNPKRTKAIVIDDTYSSEFDSNKKNVGFDLEPNELNNDPELEFGKPFRSRSAPHKRKPKFQNPHIFLRTSGKKKNESDSSSTENLDEDNPFRMDIQHMSNEQKLKKQEEMQREINRLENILQSENTTDKTKTHYSSKGKPKIELLPQLSEDDEDDVQPKLPPKVNHTPVDPSGNSSLSERRKLPKMTVEIPLMGNTGQADAFQRHYELMTQKQEPKKLMEEYDSSCNASTKNTESKKDDSPRDSYSSKRRVKRRIRVSLHDGSRSPAPHLSNSSKPEKKAAIIRGNDDVFSTPKKESPHLSKNTNTPRKVSPLKNDPNVEIVVRDGKRKIKRKVSITPSNTSNRSHSPTLHSKSSRPSKSTKVDVMRESPIEKRNNANQNNASLGDFLNEISTSPSYK